MLTTYDTIQELRAELASCHMTLRERAGVQAALDAALTEQAELDRAFDKATAALLAGEAAF